MPIMEIVTAIWFLAIAGAVGYEIYDWRTGNHPFQHMN